METDNVLGGVGAVCRLRGAPGRGPVHGAVGHREDPVQNRGGDSERVVSGAGAVHRGPLLRLVPGREDQEVRVGEEALKDIQ